MPTNVHRTLLTVLITSGWWAWSIWAIPNLTAKNLIVMGVALTVTSAILLFWNVAQDIDHADTAKLLDRYSKQKPTPPPMP